MVTGVRRIRPCARGNPRSSLRPGEWLFRDSRGRSLGQWRMTFTIQEPTSPAATTGCAPILPAGWSRMRISSIFPTGSCWSFASPMRTGSMSEPSTLLSYRQALDLRRGMLFRTVSFEDGQGRRTTLKERRLVSMDNMHLGALELALTAENWSAARHGAFGDRWAGRQRRREALSKVQQQTPGAAGWRNRWRGRRLSAGAHLPVEHSCRAGGANTSIRRRTTSRGRAPDYRRTGLHRPGTRRSTSGRAKPWCWKSSPLSIRRGIRPSPSAAWLRARRLRARAASTR